MKTIPVEIKGVDLRIDLRVDEQEAGAKLAEALKVVEQIREKFGNDVLIEQLGVILAGHIEKVTIVGGERKPVNTPVQVSVPTQPAAPTFEQLKKYRIATPKCPITGYHLDQLDPTNLRDILATKAQFLHPQDAQFIGAYLAALDAQPKPAVPPQQLSLDQDHIPY